LKPLPIRWFKPPLLEENVETLAIATFRRKIEGSGQRQQGWQPGVGCRNVYFQAKNISY
jgi:hypothetical protein